MICRQFLLIIGGKIINLNALIRAGMSAMMLSLLTICSAGDHIVASSQLYGGSFNLLRLTLPRFGIETTFVKPRDIEGFKNAIKPNTKCIFGELIGNPGIEIMNLPEVSKIAKDAGIPVIIDGTLIHHTYVIYLI